MISRKLKHPICVFNINEFGSSAVHYLKKIKNYFHSLKWDDYMLRHMQIEYLLNNIPKQEYNQQENVSLFRRYYSGDASESELQCFFDKLDKEQYQQYRSIEPSRRRSIVYFKIQHGNNGIIIERTENKKFSQSEALVSGDRHDWRLIDRRFKDADKNFIDDGLYQIIKALAQKIFNANASVYVLELAVHFTQVVSTTTSIASNSPEGIHQDGMDYIVSALVVDRENVEGGKSTVYGSDKETPLMEVVLMPGTGLFQPDKGTDLWHSVDAIIPNDPSKPAYRSTIGFDFKLCH